MVGEPRFFVFIDVAYRVAIGEKLYYQAKVGSFRDSIRVLRESIGVSVFVCGICNLLFTIKGKEKSQNIPCGVRHFLIIYPYGVLP